jgi:hypothetical protein
MIYAFTNIGIKLAVFVPFARSFILRLICSIERTLRNTTLDISILVLPVTINLRIIVSLSEKIAFLTSRLSVPSLVYK